MQERRTKNGKIFKIYKFRTMVVGAESQEVGLFNYENDERVTKVGRFLRKTSIDELPQLINVFIGNMSLVGPRPPVSYELGDFDTLNSKYKKRFETKAGITGLAQVQLRNSGTWAQKVEYDNVYVDKFKRQGLWLDTKILFGTVFMAFKRKDVYETKIEGMTDEESAKYSEEQTIYLAHIPDEE